MDINFKERLLEFGIASHEEFIQRAYSRNIGILSHEDMKILSNTKVAIPGMGGVGGIHLITLVRLGIGKFHIADFDKFDVVNTNRQYGAKVSNYGKPKVHCMAGEALNINPYLEITSFKEGLSEKNLDTFLDGVDVVVDSLDFFEFDIRRSLFNRARDKGIYVVTAGPLGFGSAVLVFAPDRGMSFDDYFDVYDGMPNLEKYINFALGLAPKGLHIKYLDRSQVDLKSKKGPSSIIACNLCGALAATEVLKIVLNKGKVRPVPFFMQFDPFRKKFVRGYLLGGNKNVLQQVKKYVITKYILKLSSFSEDMEPVDVPCVSSDDILTEEVVEFLLKAGISAPSGDNAQPWRFCVKDKKIYVYLDAEKDESFFNVDQLASIISCGAVVENMKIAASGLKIMPQIDILPKGDDNLMSILDFTDVKECEVDKLYECLWKRHTNRKFYKKQDVDDFVLQRIKKQGERFSGVEVKIITDRKKIDQIAKLVYEVDKIRVEFRPLHEHLMRMIRFNHRQMYTTKDGLPIKNLEAGIHGEMFLRLTRPWIVMNLFNKLGISKLVAHHSYRCIKSGSGVGLITVEGSNTESFLKGGMAMQRVWLETTKSELHFQPMTAITLFWERWKRYPQTFLERHREMLDGIWPKYGDIFELDLKRDETHIMLFRFGIAPSDIQVRTLRQDISKFLCDFDKK